MRKMKGVSFSRTQVYVSEVTFRKPLRMGTGCHGNQPCAKKVELSALPSDLQGRKRGWRLT